MSDNYREYLTRFRTWLNDVNEHELKGMQQAFSDFQKELSELGHYSKDQLRDYAYFIKRDIEHTRENWQKDENTEIAASEFNEEWWAALSHLVDKTQLEWSLLQDDFEHKGVYKQGEWVSFGEFKCRHCGESIHVTHPFKLDVCIECDGIEFTRIPYAP